MKLVVQVPCLNEEQTLPLVLGSIPKKIKGIDSIEILIIDDGCTDRTVEIAKDFGVKHFVTHPKNKGLAKSFHDGIYKALEMGADIIVNTDGDNQYPQERIADLVQPIVNGEADVAIADRQVKKIKHFSPAKKLLQTVGTKVLNIAAGTEVADAPSGFRAYSRDAAMQLNVVTRFSYTMETIIQAGNKNMSIVSVPVETNPKTRESRLFKNSWEHIRKSGVAITRAFIMYRPYVVFISLALFLGILGLIPFCRYMFFFIFKHPEASGHIQSLILGLVLLVGAFISFALGVIADLTRINRTLLEDILEQTRRSRFDK
ncbi:MAG TPA: glycosyltransferase family 2 protein [Candidatus Saccharimonadales bacterium]|nr:glycosyltransferase family 2 protein [Candidatus Saccharimonadales bacterium]